MKGFWENIRKRPAAQDRSFFMARQPIFDRDMRLTGYELLYRRSGDARGSQIDSEAELAALANVLVEVGLDRLAPRTKAFVNVPASLLGSDALMLLPRNQVVLEILEDTPWSRSVERHLGELGKAGYTLALDDYLFGAEHEPFLDHVDIIKVDVLGMNPDRLKAKMRELRRAGKTYLAEKVETHSTMQYCRSLGFEFFQGYFIAEPKVIKGTGIPANHALSIALLARLNDPKASLEELERMLAGNVVLTHKVLRLVNSVEMALPQRIDSIRQALLFLGIDKVRTLATLAVTTAIRGKTPELYAMAIIRANYCEALAKSVGYADPGKHFMVGLLSVLEALTDVPMRSLVEELPLSSEIAAALTGDAPKSQCATTLRHVLAVEHGNWKAADAAIRGVPASLYMDAVGRAKRDEQLLAA
ncbi:MAG TPA: HDOD domain-containing protein [Fimbriimonadaceae bacterium]|nr:HDOD domain-containing protein [Fimbriimonadaceae bacterium]